MNKGDRDGAPKIRIMERTVRPLGSSELTLCKSLAGGTGITVTCLLFSKHHHTLTVQNILCNLQSAHPLLRSRLSYQKAKKAYSFIIMPAPYIKVQEIDAKSTSSILQPDSPSSSFLQIVEHELNEDMWSKIHSPSNTDLDVFSARFYELEDGMRLLALQILTAVVDRPAADSLTKEFLKRLAQVENEAERINTKAGLPLEDMIPKKKGIWSTGRNMLSSALISVGLTYLSFKDTKSLPRRSRIVRLELDQIQTQNLLAGCESRGTNIHGAFAAAALIAAHSSNNNKNDASFGLISVFDCRSSLNSPLTTNDIGFYSTGVLTSHSVGKNVSFWSLAVNIHESFVKTKKTGNYFNDLEFGNYLFCKTIENPGLTPSSSQRTGLISVFEEPSITNKECWKEKLGLEDMILCGSAHGAGPCIATMDTIEDGRFICSMTYPSPLHSEEQMMEVVDKITNVLVSATQ